MQSSFQASDSGQAVIRHTTSVGTDELVISMHPEGDSSIEVQIRDDTPGDGVISNAMRVNREELQQLVDWLRLRGVVQ